MGTADGPRDGYSDALPWLTFVGGGASQHPAAAVVSQEWTEERDGTGQPITPTRAVWLPWTKASALPATYLSLWKATRTLRWPEVNAGPDSAARYQVDLSIPQPRWDLVVDDIERYGFALVSNLAAHIVSGKQVVVVLNQNNAVLIEERVRFLDAVMTLLPFGARNCVPVATWASAMSNHAAMLTFSNGVRPDQIAVPWPHIGQLTPPTGRGKDYLDEFGEIRMVGHDTEDIVNHLLADLTHFADVHHIAVDSLRRIRLDSLVHEEIQRDTATVATVCEVLDRQAYPRKYLSDYVTFLGIAACADHGEEKKAERALVDHWDREFGPVLGDLVRQDARRQYDWPEKLLKLSLRADDTDKTASLSYLAGALRAPVVRPGDPMLPLLANLVLNCLASGKAIDRPTYECLVGQPHAVVDAMGTILRPDSSRKRRIMAFRDQHEKNIDVALTSLTNLAEHRTRWLRAILLAASGERGRIDEQDIAALAALGVDAFICFIDVFRSKAHPNATVETAWPVVTEFLAGADGQGKVHELVESLSSTLAERTGELSPANRARVDFWLVRTLRDPKNSELKRWSDDTYLHEFLEALRRPGLPPMARARLVAFLASKFEKLPIDTVVRLDRESGIPLKAEFLSYAADLVLSGRQGQVPLMDLPADWSHDLLARPDLCGYRAWLELAELVGAHAHVDSVSDKAALALKYTFIHDETLSTLCCYVETCGPSVAVELIWQLQNHSEAGQKVATSLRDALLEGRCGAVPATNFKGHVNENLDRLWQENNKYVWLGRKVSTRLGTGGSQ
jgi:hypothetical protein